MHAHKAVQIKCWAEMYNYHRFYIEIHAAHTLYIHITYYIYVCIMCIYIYTLIHIVIMAFALEPSAHFSCHFRQKELRRCSIHIVHTTGLKHNHRWKHSDARSSLWAKQHLITTQSSASSNKGCWFSVCLFFWQWRLRKSRQSGPVIKEILRFSRDSQRMIPERFVTFLHRHRFTILQSNKLQFTHKQVSFKQSLECYFNNNSRKTLLNLITFFYSVPKAAFDLSF